MKTYTEFETEQELRDYLNSLNGVNAEMELKEPKGKWYPLLSCDVQRILGVGFWPNFKARVPHKVIPPVVALDEPHAELRKQYEEDCKWYNEPWKFWEQSMSGVFEPLKASPLWYRNKEYRRTEPTVTMPDGTVLPRPVDKVPAGANWYRNGVIDTMYKTEEDRTRVARYINELAKIARGDK